MASIATYTSATTTSQWHPPRPHRPSARWSSSLQVLQTPALACHESANRACLPHARTHPRNYSFLFGTFTHTPKRTHSRFHTTRAQHRWWLTAAAVPSRSSCGSTISKSSCGRTSQSASRQCSLGSLTRLQACLWVGVAVRRGTYASLVDVCTRSDGVDGG